MMRDALYGLLPQSTFDEALRVLVSEEPSHLLDIPGVYDLVKEAWHNDVLEECQHVALDEYGGLTLHDLDWLLDAWTERVHGHMRHEDHDDHDDGEGYEEVMVSLGYVGVWLDGRVAVHGPPPRRETVPYLWEEEAATAALPRWRTLVQLSTLPTGGAS